MTGPQLFIIRGPDGKPEAIHERIERREGPGLHGKMFAWWSLGPDGQPVKNLQGRKVESLPLFGSQHVGKWDTSRPVFVCEGEKDAMALLTAEHRALGTVGGAGVIPSDGALAVLIGFDVVLWPDNDPSGRRLMQGIGQRLQNATASLRWVEWPDAPAGGGAADYVAAGLQVEDLTLGPVPMPAPAAIIPLAAKRRSIRFNSDSPIASFNAAVTVSDVLRRDFGPWDHASKVAAGRNVACPFHDDEHPSMKIYSDDRRVLCFASACWANNNGRGRDAWDLAHGLQAVAR